MPLSTRLTLPALLAFMPALAADASATKPVAATVETTLATAAGQIRQFVFDGDGRQVYGVWLDLDDDELRAPGR